ncbi:hypothetical protein SAMN04490244_1125 [Tranquillimonas rosea]|uniref:Uncharacterized protein n=1 Tax=Tranquillimonas rosea TaxID=641238 RepID=A0A1H9WNW6_9RHOB|nr:hypothetical protein SAMN04490244_1125 [Tranquillimonas rosea]
MPDTKYSNPFPDSYLPDGSLFRAIKRAVLRLMNRRSAKA